MVYIRTLAGSPIGQKEQNEHIKENCIVYRTHHRGDFTLLHSRDFKRSRKDPCHSASRIEFRENET